ncbi:MAG: lytic transglycosylase domain-containing protein, partial [Deltaproteobacteria bacterium]|nr:lytic transglycosylase domain-containing protein [Deltaproteobacteria bacterium]
SDYIFNLRLAGYNQRDIEEILFSTEGLKRVRSRCRLVMAGFSRKEAYLLIPRDIPTPVPKPSGTDSPFPRQTNLNLLIKKVLGPFLYLIKKVSARYKLPRPIVEAVIIAESGGDPKARSSKGAMGLMQLMPVTAREVGVRNAFDPAQNIEGGCKYLRKMWNMFQPRWDLALAAYNAGPTRVAKLAAVPKIPETAKYVKRVFSLADSFNSVRNN